MYLFRSYLAIFVSVALLASPAFALHVHRSPTAGAAHHHHRLSSRRHYTHRVRGQQAIEPERVTQIQEALVKAHYMTAAPNGNWDAATIAAMQKYQADHGWQTKLMPDSRALEKLGLGPDYSNAINAKDAAFDAPPPVSTIPPDQAAGFAAASHVEE